VGQREILRLYPFQFIQCCTIFNSLIGVGNPFFYPLGFTLAFGEKSRRKCPENGAK